MKVKRVCAVYGRDLISEVRNKNIQLFASWVLLGFSVILNVAFIFTDGGCR